MDEYFSVRDSRELREFKICGMGGVGKTQIIAKFVDVYGERLATYDCAQRIN